MSELLDRFDVLVIAVIAALLVAIAGVVLAGDQVGVYVSDGDYGPQGIVGGAQPVYARFSDAMSASSVAEHFRIDPPVPGDITWPGQNTLLFTPRQPWLAGQTYTVTVERGARASRRSGVLQKTLSWTFTARLPRVVYLAPSDEMDRNLYRADLQTGEAVPLTASTEGIEDFAVSPNGSEIAFSQNNPFGTSNLWVLSVADQTLRQVTNCVAARCYSPAWKPDGTQLAYQRDDFNTGVGIGVSASRAWIVDLASLQTQLLFADAQMLGATPSWSPTGQRIAVFDTAASGIRVYDYASGSNVMIESLVGVVGHWSPDGKKLIYPEITRGSLGSEFYTTLEITDFETMTRVPLGDPGGIPVDDGDGVWSPDGQWLLVTRRYLDNRYTPGKQLYLLDPEMGEAQPLVVDAAYYHAGAHWDPSGERIIFQRYPLQQAGARPGVWMVDLATGELRQVAENAMLPQWLP